MATGKHLQPFNPPPELAPADASFRYFGQLHKELRIHIWELLLERQRFIHIELAHNGRDGAQSQSIEDSPYTVVAQGPLALSSLMHVSGEARDVALQYYREPEPFEPWPYPAEQTTNAYDFTDQVSIFRVFINGGDRQEKLDPGKNIPGFLTFLSDVRALDPRRTGVANLAMLSLAGLDLIPALNETETAALKESVSSLREVYFMSVERAGRMHSGPRNGIHYIRRYEMHRSRPIFSTAPAFERLKRDPRNIDLKHVFLGTSDPRAKIFQWRAFLKKWNIELEEDSIQYRILISCSLGSSRNPERIIDRETACRWLIKEDEKWMDLQRRHEESIIRRGGRVPIESPEDLDRAPQPAIGFWLFPIEAVGPLPDEIPDELSYHNQTGNLKAKRVVNMSKYWPELCLSVLA